MKNNRRKVGKWGEQRALEYLLNKKYRLIAQNWANRYGELDLVMEDGNTLVFVEVRTKGNHYFGTGFESINQKKQQQLFKMANMFLANDRWTDTPMRFDAISIDFSTDGTYSIFHLKNIF